MELRSQDEISGADLGDIRTELTGQKLSHIACDRDRRLSNREELVDDGSGGHEQHRNSPSPDGRRRHRRVVLVRDDSSDFRIRAMVDDQGSFDEHQARQGLVGFRILLRFFIVEELLRLSNDQEWEPRIVFMYLESIRQDLLIHRGQ